MTTRATAALVALLATGLAWGVHLPVLLALLVGLVAAGVYLGVSALTGRTQPPRGRADLTLSANAGSWCKRAQAAVREVDEMTLASTNLDGAEVRSSAALVLDAFERTVSQVSSLEMALARIDPGRLQIEVQHIEAEHARARGELRKELERTLVTLSDQIEVYNRLSEAHATQVAKLRSGAVGLEGLVTRLAEVTALRSTSGDLDLTATRVNEVTESLESIRLGLRDAAAESKRLLGEI